MTTSNIPTWNLEAFCELLEDHELLMFHTSRGYICSDVNATLVLQGAWFGISPTGGKAGESELIIPEAEFEECLRRVFSLGRSLVVLNFNEDDISTPRKLVLYYENPYLETSSK